MSPNHLISAAAVALFCASASAIPIFDEFGPLPEATFGGTGIPNDEVAAGTQFVDGFNTVTVALSATQRFSNPVLTNDMAGTYFATTGSNFGGMGESATEGALWNFNFYMEAVDDNDDPIALATNYQIDLFYDFDPGEDTPSSDWGSINVTNALLADMDFSNVAQGSQNLNFGFLATSIPGFINAPTGSFDPNAAGEYTFALTISDPTSGLPLETVAINVVVVPGASTLALLGPTGLVAMRRRRR